LAVCVDALPHRDTTILVTDYDRSAAISRNPYNVRAATLYDGNSVANTEVIPGHSLGLLLEVIHKGYNDWEGGVSTVDYRSYASP
jgi:hypothetical protein